MYLDWTLYRRLRVQIVLNYQLKNEVSQNNFNMYARIYNQQPFPGSMVEQIFTSDCSCCKCHSYSGDDEDDEEMEDDEGEGKVT